MGETNPEKTSFCWEVYLSSCWPVDESMHCLPRDGGNHLLAFDCPCEPEEQVLAGPDVVMYKHRALLEALPVPDCLPEDL